MHRKSIPGVNVRKEYLDHPRRLRLKGYDKNTLKVYGMMLCPYCGLGRSHYAMAYPPATAIGRHVRLIYLHACAAASLRVSSRLVDGVDFKRLSRKVTGDTADVSRSCGRASATRERERYEPSMALGPLCNLDHAGQPCACVTTCFQTPTVIPATAHDK
jgi:hypothetical protein